MNGINRIILNTIILYLKILVCMFVSLYTVPLVLHSLGTADYGLYNLIAGVIVMLSFLNAAMAVSTQRYLSVTIGTGDSCRLNTIYNVSIVLHILIGLLIVCVFELCTLFLFDGFLNILPDRVSAAKTIYQFLVISTFFTILAVPFDAAINAHEHMLAFAIISIIEAILKLSLAFSLSHIDGDKLIFYGLGMATISLLGVVMKVHYTYSKYHHLKINIRSYFDKTIFKEMSSFSGWSTLGSFAMIGRNQGAAVVLNIFLGTTVNAAYGIANQINGVLISFSTTLQKSINPQLMQSEGMKNRERMIKIAFASSKYSVLILSFLAIPLLIELPYVLALWLNTIPDYTNSFLKLILILSIIQQYSAGLQAAIYSNGKIKKYTIIITLLLLFNIPASYFLLKHGFCANYIFVSFIGLEIIALCFRIILSHKMVNISISSYLKKIIIPTSSLIMCTYFSVSFLREMIEIPLFRFLFSVISSCLLLGTGTYFFIFSLSERAFVNSFLLKNK